MTKDERSKVTRARACSRRMRAGEAASSERTALWIELVEGGMKVSEVAEACGEEYKTVHTAIARQKKREAA